MYTDKEKIHSMSLSYLIASKNRTAYLPWTALGQAAPTWGWEPTATMSDPFSIARIILGMPVQGQNALLLGKAP